MLFQKINPVRKFRMKKEIWSWFFEKKPSVVFSLILARPASRSEVLVVLPRQGGYYAPAQIPSGFCRAGENDLKIRSEIMLDFIHPKDKLLPGSRLVCSSGKPPLPLNGAPPLGEQARAASESSCTEHIFGMF